MSATSNSAKAKVLKKYPGAYAKEGLLTGDWYIHIPDGSSTRIITFAPTAAEAWKRAARKHAPST